MPRKRLLFRVSAYLYVVNAGLHLAGQLAGAPELTDEAGRHMVELMRTYHLDFGGIQRTPMEILDGHALSAAAFAFFLGVLDLAIIRFGEADRAFIQTVILLNILLGGLQLGIAAAFLLYPSILCFGLAFLGFTAAFVTPGETGDG